MPGRQEGATSQHGSTYIALNKLAGQEKEVKVVGDSQGYQWEKKGGRKVVGKA